MLCLVSKIPNSSPNKDFYKKEFYWIEEQNEFGIFVEDSTEIGAISYSITQSCLYIHYIVACKPGKGDGKKMIEFLKKLPNVQKIEGGSRIDSIGFWKNIGACFLEEETINEGSFCTKTFVINCN